MLTVYVHVWRVVLSLCVCVAFVDTVRHLACAHLLCQPRLSHVFALFSRYGTYLYFPGIACVLGLGEMCVRYGFRRGWLFLSLCLVLVLLGYRRQDVGCGVRFQGDGGGGGEGGHRRCGTERAGRFAGRVLPAQLLLCAVAGGVRHCYNSRSATGTALPLCTVERLHKCDTRSAPVFGERHQTQPYSSRRFVVSFWSFLFSKLNEPDPPPLFYMPLSAPCR